MDPIEFRLKNGLREGDPTLDRRSPQWPRIGLLECLEKAQEQPLWAKRDEQKTPLSGELEGWRIGVGVAAGGWPGGTEPAVATCRLESDGTMTVVVGTVDLTGSDTSLALIAAAQDARSQVLSIAADILEASAADLEIEGDKVVVRGSPGSSVALTDIAARSMTFAGKYEP